MGASNRWYGNGSLIAVRPFSMRGRKKQGWHTWHLFAEIGIGRTAGNALTSKTKDFLIMEICG